MSTTPYLDPQDAIKQAALAWRPGQPAIPPYQAGGTSAGLNLPGIGSGKLGAPPPEPQPMPETAMSMPSSQPRVIAPRGTLAGDKAESARLLNNGAGLNQIQNPILHGAAKVGDVLGSILAPGLTAKIPGTTLHNQVLLGQANKAVASDEANAHTEAQTAEENSLPALHQAQLENAENKQQETEQHHQQQVEEQLHVHGYKTDPTGKVVPLEYSEMSEQQQAVHDLKGAQEEEANATSELKKLQANPNSPQYQMMQARIQGAQQARQIAMRRLGLAEKTFDARYHGTDTNGQALPGAMITDEGLPVGSSFSQNVRPTGTERNKSDMAGSAKEQLESIREIVHRRPDIFGPAAGRKTDFDVWVGSQDPDAQAFRASRTIAGDHLAGTFGGRSETALSNIDSAIGHFKDNPAAIDAGINKLIQANDRFLEAGTVRTAGSKANTEAQSQPQSFTENGRVYNIPADKVAEFKKDHPNAR